MILALFSLYLDCLVFHAALYSQYVASFVPHIVVLVPGMEPLVLTVRLLYLTGSTSLYLRTVNLGLNPQVLYLN